MNDCNTFIYAKTQSDWEKHADCIGGGNFATPLILFPLWDFFGGLYAYTFLELGDYFWSEEAELSIKPTRTQVTKAIRQATKDASACKHLKLEMLKPGRAIKDEKVLEAFLIAFEGSVTLGVSPHEFAFEVRRKVRNPLAHAYAPKLGTGVKAIGATSSTFGEVLEWLSTINDPVAEANGDDWDTNAMAMLRDSRRLSDALKTRILEAALPERANATLKWLQAQ